MGFNNPNMPWWELEAALSDRPPPASAAGTVAPRGRRRGTRVATARRGAASASRTCHHRRRSHQAAAASRFAGGAVRRAALPHQLLVPRRRLASRATGGGSCPPRSRSAGGHRSRWPLRRGPLRRGGACRRPADGVRRRDHARLGQRARGRCSPKTTPSSRSPPVSCRIIMLPIRTAIICSCSPTGPRGYARLARALSLGHLAGEKSAPQFTLLDIADAMAGHGWVLTGCRKGAVPAALVDHGPAAAAKQLQRLIELFGRDRVVVELWDHGDPLDSARNDALAELAARHDLACVATNNVHYATPSQRRLATAIAAVRARRSLDELDPWLPASTGAHLRSGAEQARRFMRYPGVVEAAAEIGRAAAFDLSLVAPNLPPFPCPQRPRRHDAHRDAVPASSRRAGWPPSIRRATVGPRRPVVARQGVEHHRPRARRHRAPRVRRLLPGRLGPRRVLQPGRHLLPRPGQRGQQRGVLRARHHQGRCGVARSAVRTVPVDRARWPSRHRHRHRERPARGGHPVRVPAVRPAPHRPGRQRHHLSGAVGGARHGQGARLRTRPAGCVEQADRRVGQRRRRRPTSPITASRQPCSSWPPRSKTHRATSASTPAAWSSAIVR